MRPGLGGNRLLPPLNEAGWNCIGLVETCNPGRVPRHTETDCDRPRSLSSEPPSIATEMDAHAFQYAYMGRQGVSSVRISLALETELTGGGASVPVQTCEERAG